ncbi:MAG TPA: flagellar regulator YcgR PilZN domain-containing protein [Gammaproteobacteria bacterium]
MVKTSESANAPEIISDHTRIMSLINRLYQERASLTITLPNSKLRSKSIILDLNSETGRFVLNKIQPDTAHEKLMGSRKFYARGQIKGIEIRFSSNLIDTFTEEDDIYYLVTIPGKIDYHQRRAFHRVSLSHLDTIPVTLELENNMTLEGQMDDISAGGLSILFSSDLPDSLQLGTIIEQCIFKIPGEDRVKCELRIRFINHGHETSLPKIGAQFVNMEKPLQKTLQRFIAAMDRQIIKDNIT